MPERASVDYHEAITSTSKSVLLEIMTVLKTNRDSLVLIGGWVPYFLLRDNQPAGSNFNHIGSIDIDFVINPETIDEAVYTTMAQMLLKRGYSPSKDLLYQFERTVKSEIDGKQHTIKIDFPLPCPATKAETPAQHHTAGYEGAEPERCGNCLYFKSKDETFRYAAGQRQDCG